MYLHACESIKFFFFFFAFTLIGTNTMITISWQIRANLFTNFSPCNRNGSYWKIQFRCMISKSCHLWDHYSSNTVFISPIQIRKLLCEPIPPVIYFIFQLIFFISIIWRTIMIFFYMSLFYTLFFPYSNNPERRHEKEEFIFIFCKMLSLKTLTSSC